MLVLFFDGRVLPAAGGASAMIAVCPAADDALVMTVVRPAAGIASIAATVRPAALRISVVPAALRIVHCALIVSSCPAAVLHFTHPACIY